MADNFTFLDAAQATKTVRAVDNSTIYLPATVLADAAGTLIAADDAAAAGPIFPAAGVYQATVDEVNDGDIGRVRMSARRALITEGDCGETLCFNAGGTGGALDGSIRDTAAHALTMTGNQTKAKRRSIFIINGLNQNVSLIVSIFDAGLTVQSRIYSATLNAGAAILLTDEAGGTGVTQLAEVPALKCICGALQISVTAVGTPSSGTLTATMYWSM